MSSSSFSFQFQLAFLVCLFCLILPTNGVLIVATAFADAQYDDNDANVVERNNDNDNVNNIHSFGAIDVGGQQQSSNAVFPADNQQNQNQQQQTLDENNDPNEFAADSNGGADALINLTKDKLLIVPQPSSSENACFYGWAEPIEKNESNKSGENGIGGEDNCKSATDCGTSNAWCVFSPVVQRRICCRNRANAVLPECPSQPPAIANTKTAAADKKRGALLKLPRPWERIHTPLVVDGPVNGALLCDANKAGEGEKCPLGFECVQSRTQFQKSYGGQPNTICCPRSRQANGEDEDEE